ncbi:nitrilase [Pseudonocardiaceae bacterium YIM PH 21723]|nr:nitrilase [Pseudonocardiaceae bacterium YIM PH 21723]
MTRVVKAAVVQAAPVPFQVDATLNKVERLVRQATAGGTRLVVFPEAFVTCYPSGNRFGAVVGERSPEGHEWFRRYFDAAIPVPGPATERLGQIAGAHEVYLVIGVIERAGGTLYCTVLTFAPDGALLGKHRKVMPTVAERMVWGFGDGSTLPVFDTPLGRLGSVICWENYMPAMRMAMYAKGIELYCAPTADDRDVWLASMRHIAREGRCFVLSACQYLRRRDLPPDWPNESPLEDSEVLLSGNSVIVAPTGEILAGPYGTGETVLRAELDLDELGRAKFGFDAVGHYSRPDIFRLTVNENAHPAVTFEGYAGKGE